MTPETPSRDPLLKTTKNEEPPNAHPTLRVQVSDFLPMTLHQLQAEEIQNDLIRKMSPARRLETALSLYKAAWDIKKSGLRSLHPDWTEAALEARTRRVFVTGYAGD